MILHHTRTLDFETCRKAAMKYNCRSAFSRDDSVAYRKAAQMGWLEIFFPDVKPSGASKGKPRKSRRVLDYDTCRKSAARFSTRNEFRKGDEHAYLKSCRNGWISEFFPEKVLRKSEVTFEQCLAVAEMLRSEGKNKISDFIEYNGNLYAVCRKNGWIPKLGFQDKKTSMTEAGLRKRKYTIEYATAVAKKYSTLRDFMNNEHGLYAWCREHGLMDSFTWLERMQTVYTEELIRATVAKYTDYTEFCRENRAMYTYMARHDLLHLASSLERKVQFDGGYAVDCVYAYEFPGTNHAYIGRTVKPAVRDWEHRNRKDDSVYRYAEKHSLEIPEMKILASGITVQEGPAIEQKMMDTYVGNGWNLVNSVKGGSLGGMGYQKKWTMERMLEVAHQFTYWDDLERAHSGLIQKIYKKKLAHMFPWLKHRNNVPGFWKNLSESEAYDYARECSSIKEFETRYKCLCGWARKRGWLGKWFGKPKTGKKLVEQYTLDRKFVALHESIEQAARAIGIKAAWLSHVCRYRPMKGKCGGFLFKFHDDDNAATEEETRAAYDRRKNYWKNVGYVKRKAWQDENREEYLSARRRKYAERKASR